MKVHCGLDMLLRDPEAYLGGDSVGLVTNPTGVTLRLESALDAFYQHEKIKLQTVFGPEHGARGDIQDALDVSSHIDPSTGLTVHSLYGAYRAPSEEMLDGIDTLVFDIQDCGSRYYTYVSTLTNCMESAKKYGVKLVILDRPNPVNGVSFEGNILEHGYESFVGLHPIPIRHGLTMGELAHFINTGIKCDLEVVLMRGWRRSYWFDETGLPWVQPSPNLPSLDTAVVYNGTCLFEGVNASEGRGTTKPFEYLGAPWVDDKAWVDALNKIGLPGVLFRRSYFTPTFWRFRDEQCNGVQVHVTDRDQYRSVETGLHLLSTLMMTHPSMFRFNEPTYDERRHFDLLAGTDKLRLQLMAGVPVEEITASWEPEVNKYLQERSRHLLYPEDE